MRFEHCIASGFICVISVLSPTTVSAQDEALRTERVAENDKIRICMPATSGISDPETGTLSKETVDGCTDISANPTSRTKVRNNYLVLVFIGSGQTKKLGDLGVRDVSMRVNGGRPVRCGDPETAAEVYAARYFWQCIVDDRQLANVSQGDGVNFIVTANNSEVRYAEFTRPLTFAGKASGFWIPVGVFGTNFQSNKDGITIAALPIGLAWGAQYNFSGDTFIGASAFVSWSITPQKSEDGKATGNYTLASASPGAFIDFDGYVYTGYAYALDFRADYKNPGHMFVIGVGPRLLQVLKAQ